MANFPDDAPLSSAEATNVPAPHERAEDVSAGSNLEEILSRMEENLSMEREQLRSLLRGSIPNVAVPLCRSAQEIQSAMWNVGQLLSDIGITSFSKFQEKEKPAQTLEHMANILQTCNSYLTAIEVGLHDKPEVVSAEENLNDIHAQTSVQQDIAKCADGRGMWKKLSTIRARGKASKAVEDLEQRKERAQNLLEECRSDYDKLQKSYDACRKRVREGYVAGVWKHFDTVLEKEKEIFDALKTPERKAEWNKLLLEIRVHPTLQKVVATDQLSEDEAARYLELLEEILQEGYDYPFNGAEDNAAWERRQARNKEFQDLNSKSYDLQSTLSSVSGADSGCTGNEYYDIFLRLLVNQETKKRIQREAQAIMECINDDALREKIQACIEHVFRGRDAIQKEDWASWESPKNMRNVDIDTWSHREIPMDGIERWNVLKKSPLLQSVIAPETFAEAEKCMAEKFGKGYLLAGGRESWDGTRAAAVLDLIGTPHAIPYILKLFEQSGTGHTSAAAGHHLESLIAKVPTAEMDAALAEYPRDVRDAVALLRDREHSYLARYSGDKYSFAHILQNLQRTFRQEQIAAAMEKGGASPDELQSFYILAQRKSDLFATLCKYAEPLGMSKKELVQEYFEELTKHFSLEDPECVTLIQDIATELRETPETIFERKKEHFHLQKHDEIGHAHKALQNICSIAAVTGLPAKNLVEEFLPDLLTGIHNYSDDIAVFVRDLACALEETPRTSLNRVQPKLTDHLHSPKGFLEQLHALSRLPGINQKELAEEYFEQLTANFSLVNAESIELMLDLAEMLGEKPQDVFERTKQRFHLREHGQIRDAHKALQNVHVIAGATDLPIKDLTEEFLQDLLTGIHPNCENIPGFVSDLAAALKETPRESLSRVQPNLKGSLRKPGQFLEQLRKLGTLPEISEKELVMHHLPQFLASINLSLIRELPDELALSLGCTRTDIIRKFSEENAVGFAACAERNDWRSLHDEKIFTEFLAALPSDTDEKRNAFTHNPYDRTSEFMMTMNLCPEFGFHKRQGMEDITEYVRKFGLSKTGKLFQYFQNLRKLERKEINALPEEQVQNRITTMTDLEERVKEFRALVYGEKPLTKLQDFNVFELEMLATVTNHSAHRFERGRASVQEIVEDFERNTEQGLITPVPPEYGVSTFKIDQVHIDFDPEKIQEDFGVLSGEMLRSIKHAHNIANMRERACTLLQKNIADLQVVLEKQPQNKFIQQQVQSAQEVLSNTEKVATTDELIKALLDMQRAQAEKYDIAGVLREALFHKFLEKHYSPAMIQNLQASLGRGPTPQGVLAIVDIVQNSIKDHILNLEDDNKKKYWPADCWKKIQEKKGKKTALDLRMAYEGRIKALKKEAESFEQISTGVTKTVRAIPDRGLIGEMSGYLANACYTAEYPLLTKFPNVVPVKFVSGKEESSDAELIGSLLYFEIETESGKALLARAFNVPGEADLDIQAFIEQNLDRAASTAQKRGCSYVVVPGVSGAISNYPLTNNHIHTKYIAGKTPLKLKQRFAFNNYDLTKSCYIARTIEKE